MTRTTLTPELADDILHTAEESYRRHHPNGEFRGLVETDDRHLCTPLELHLNDAQWSAIYSLVIDQGVMTWTVAQQHRDPVLKAHAGWWFEIQHALEAAIGDRMLIAPLTTIVQHDIEDRGGR